MITPDEHARREERVRQACHSTVMEGGHVTNETRAALDAYTAGQIDADELLARIWTRYGLPAAPPPH